MKKYVSIVKAEVFSGSEEQIKKYKLTKLTGANEVYLQEMAPQSIASARVGDVIAEGHNGNTFIMKKTIFDLLYSRVNDNKYECIVYAERITHRPDKKLLEEVNAVKYQTLDQTFYVGDKQRFPLAIKKMPILLPNSFVLRFEYRKEFKYAILNSSEFNWIYDDVFAS